MVTAVGASCVRYGCQCHELRRCCTSSQNAGKRQLHFKHYIIIHIENECVQYIVYTAQGECTITVYIVQGKGTMIVYCVVQSCLMFNVFVVTQIKRGDPVEDSEYQRSCTHCTMRRTHRDMSQIAKDEAKFDMYTNNMWTSRHSALKRFQQAARKVIILYIYGTIYMR